MCDLLMRSRMTWIQHLRHNVGESVDGTSMAGNGVSGKDRKIVAKLISAPKEYYRGPDYLNNHHMFVDLSVVKTFR